MPSQEKIRVVIVDDIADTRENIRRMLQFDTSIEVIATARTGKEAIEVTLKEKPDVVIMDINMPDMDGITATEGIRKKMPIAQVIILSVQSDPSYMQRAMRVGARDFLTKPPNIDELTAAVHRAGMMAHEERAKAAVTIAGNSPGGRGNTGNLPATGKIIPVYSAKGGTGRTMLSTNLSIALHSNETKTVLVDGNFQFGDITVFLNEQGKNSIVDLLPRVDDLDPDVVNDVVITHRASGVHLIAAPPRPELAEEVGSEQFTKLLQYLRRVYSYVIVDTISQLTDNTSAALEAADVIVLLTTQDIPSIRNASQFLNVADSAGMRDRLLFVMNRVDKRVAITPERVGESLKQPIVVTLPEEAIVSSSVNRGVPLMLENKAHPISKGILSLCDLIREKLSKKDTEGEKEKGTKR